jgi:hypothetical protein
MQVGAMRAWSYINMQILFCSMSLDVLEQLPKTGAKQQADGGMCPVQHQSGAFLWGCGCES